MTKTYVVYCHTDPLGKKYFGISCDYLKRWGNNGKGYIKNERFYKAILEYGWDNFRHEIIKENLTLDEANQLEKELIETHRTIDPDFGYNLRHGGSGGEFSLEARKNMSKSRMGNKNNLGNSPTKETRDKISKSLKEYYKTHDGTFLGRHHSQETIEKLRNISRYNNPNARSVYQIDKDGNIICRFYSASEASRELNIDASAIIKCCRGKKNTCGGFIWTYAEDVEEIKKTS